MFGTSFPAKLAAVALCLVPLCGGCQIAADFINPSVYTALGLDPDTVTPPQGRIVVAFNNTTASLATFFVTVANSDLTDLREASAEVGGGQTGNAVFDCPIDLVLPGGIATGDQGTPAVVVTTAMGNVVVNYAGVAIEAGRDFQCGDVIEVRLQQVGAGAAAADFNIRVTIRAGR